MKSSSLPLLLVGLAACAAGLGAGWFLRGDTPAHVQPLQLNAADAVTREELEAAKREILAQLEHLGRARPAGAQATTAASASPNDDVVELGRRVEELGARIALLDKRAPRQDDSPLWTPPLGPGSRSIDAMVERVQAWYHPSNTDRRGEDVEEQLRKEHDLWKFEDIVRAYGEPRRWERFEGGWNLYYACFEVVGWDDKESITFCLRETYVQTIEISNCEP